MYEILMKRKDKRVLLGIREKNFKALTHKKTPKKRRNHYFGSYILVSQSIWSLHFDSNQFGPY